MNKDSLVGTGKVYRFTLRQLLKSKANIATFVIFALIAVLSVPVACLILGRDTPPAVSEITRVYYSTTTVFEPATSDLGDYFSGVSFEYTDRSIDDAAEFVGPTELFACLESDADTHALTLTIAKTLVTDVSDAEIELLRSALSDSISKARLSAFGATQAQLDFVMSSYSLDVLTAEKYTSDDVSFMASYTIQYAYAIILFMISMFTIVYIVRAVIEEKASKLVELLMVTTKPLALLAGKILAVMTYIFGLLLSIIVLFALSFAVSGSVLDTSPISSSIAGMGLSADMLNLSPVAFIVVFISLLMAYLTFSILAGLSGTSCSTMDDVEGANMSVTFTLLGAYIISVVISSLGSGPLATIGSLVPIVSAFVAPVQYILGGIGFVTLLISWVIQLAVIAFLATFSSRVYKSLIMYSGNRVRLKTLLSIYKQSPEKEVR